MKHVRFNSKKCDHVEVGILTEVTLNHIVEEKVTRNQIGLEAPCIVMLQFI